jgi:ParB family transcriptional regulator, chromosome partitioning protein
MGKLEQLERQTAAHVDESLGVGRTAPPAAVSQAPRAAAPARWQGVQKTAGAVEIPLTMIAPDPDQPREEFEAEALDRLAASLQARGQLQPIRVRWDEGRGVYVVIVGERRWRAAQRAGLATLSAVVTEAPLEPADRLVLQLVENCLREDLQPIEQAKAFRALIAAHGWSVRRLAEELAITHSTVVRALALLELPEAVQVQVEQGTLAPRTAYEIGRLDNPAAQVAVAQAAVQDGLTRAEVTEVVQAVKARRPVPAPRPEPVVLDGGDGVTVIVKWRKACDVSLMQALRRALRQAQAMAQGEDGRAA